MHVDDLQSGVTVGRNSISGRLLYVTDYTGFSSNPAEQNGNYLALRANDTGSDKIVVELVGGTSGPVELDADKTIVLRIRNKDTQSVKVQSFKNDVLRETRTFSLSGLVLEPEVSG